MKSKLAGMVAVAALVLVLPACSGDSKTDPEQLTTEPWGEPEPEQSLEVLEVTVLAQGVYPDTGVPGPRAVQVLEDADALAAALALYDSSEAVPEVEFYASKVILLSHGWAATGGYGIAVDAAYEQDGRRLLLDVTLTRPGDDCNVTQAVTSPYQFVAVPSTRELVVREQRVINPCNGQQEAAGESEGVPLQHQVLAKGQAWSPGPPPYKHLLVLDDADDFASLWYATLTDEPLPEVDFAEHQVVLLAQGWMPNPSYQVGTPQVLDMGDHLQLDVERVRENPNCATGLVAAVNVLPYQFLLIPDDRRLVFNERIRVPGCE